MDIKKNNRPLSSNSNYNYKWFMSRLLIYVPFMSAFRRIKIALNSILNKSSKNYSSSTISSSEFKVLPRSRHSKITRSLFMNFRVIIHIQETYISENMTENKANNSKFKRSIKLEVNEGEFWSVNSE